MLEVGLLLHPHTPLDKVNTAAQRLHNSISLREGNGNWEEQQVNASPSYQWNLLADHLMDLCLSPAIGQMEVLSDDKWAENGAARKAKWWYSIFHTVTAMVGAGVLSLAYAMAYMG